MRSTLSDHTNKKGKLISPFNNILAEKITLTSWSSTRLPEFLWLGLIIDHYGRDEGFIKVINFYKDLLALTDLSTPKMSYFLNQSHSLQEKIFFMMVQHFDKKIFSPLTTIITYDVNTIFSNNFFIDDDLDYKIKKITDVLHKAYFDQSDFTTDIRYLVCVLQVMSGKFHIPSEICNELYSYQELSHDHPSMAKIRPSIRAMEMSSIPPGERPDPYVKLFWKKISQITDCQLFATNFDSENDDSYKYCDLVYELVNYISKTQKIDGLPNEKLQVLGGLIIFSYKRLLELVHHNLCNTVSGRSIVRSLIETFITMKFLIKKESENSNIWKEFQMYGIGHYKKILLQYDAYKGDYSKFHVSRELLEIIVNELQSEIFTDIDLRYFGQTSIRQKAADVGESDLYTYFYDYDSAFEHSLWGAIRESSLLMCMNPAHKFQPEFDIENWQSMKSVWYDVVRVVNKIFILYHSIFMLPDILIKRLEDYEKEINNR